MKRYTVTYIGDPVKQYLVVLVDAKDKNDAVGKANEYLQANINYYHELSVVMPYEVDHDITAKTVKKQ